MPYIINCDLYRSRSIMYRLIDDILFLVAKP